MSATRTIWFKKQWLGRWRRDDGEAKKTVNEDAMFREVAKLIGDGWRVRTYGETHLRMIEVYLPESLAASENDLG